jgi:hypothetical protein
MLYQNSTTVNILDYLPPSSNSSLLAMYRLLEPHYLSGVYYAAGSIVKEGFQIPISWVPTLAVDPLNSFAVQNFYNAGPRSLSNEDLNQWARGNPQGQIGFVAPPVTFWQASSGNLYRLTGLGASFPPVGAL